MARSGFVVTVLSGPQAGVAQSLGAGSYVVGSDDGCDLVFDEVDLAPRHARLSIDRRGVSVEPLDGLVDLSPAGGRKSRELDLGGAQRLPALVAMGRLKLMVVDDGRGLRDRANDFADRAPILHHARRAGMSGSGLAAFFGAAALVALGVWGLGQVFGSNGAASAREMTDEERLRVAMSRLDDRFVLQENGSGWILSGAVRDDGERAQVTRLFDDVRAPLEFRLRDVDRLQQAVEAVTAAFGGEVDVTVGEKGDVHLRGYVPSRDTAQQLLMAVRGDIAAVGAVTTDLFTDDSIAKALNARIAAEGLGGQLTARPADGVIRVEGGISDSQADRWSRVVDWHQGLFARYAPLDERIGQRADAPPLQIRAVWNGEQPYVVAEDGVKYMVGSVLDGGWVVEAIEDDHVSIARDGQRLVLTL